MRIEVTERPPAMVVSAGGEQVPVAADGTLLPGVEVTDDDHLPVLEVEQAPGGRQRSSGDPLDEALVARRRAGAAAAADREDRRPTKSSGSR